MLCASEQCHRWDPSDFGPSLWSFECLPTLTVNGILIGPYATEHMAFPAWSETDCHRLSNVPNVAISDPGARFPVNLARDAFSADTLPFEAELAEELAKSYIAALLLYVPTDKQQVFQQRSFFNRGYKECSDTRLSLGLGRAA